MSAQIRQERNAYHDILKATQKGTIDDRRHIVDGVVSRLPGPRYRRDSGYFRGGVLGKARFWERIRGVQMNERQRLVINRLLDGFEGKLPTSKYATLAKCSQDTAHRDILSLVNDGVFVRNPEGGRSTNYSLAPS